MNEFIYRAQFFLLFFFYFYILLPRGYSVVVRVCPSASLKSVAEQKARFDREMDGHLGRREMTGVVRRCRFLSFVSFSFFWSSSIRGVRVLHSSGVAPVLPGSVLVVDVPLVAVPPRFPPIRDRNVILVYGSGGGREGSRECER